MPGWSLRSVAHQSPVVDAGVIIVRVQSSITICGLLDAGVAALTSPALYLNLSDLHLAGHAEPLQQLECEIPASDPVLVSTVQHYPLTRHQWGTVEDSAPGVTKQHTVSIRHGVVPGTLRSPVADTDLQVLQRIGADILGDNLELLHDVVDDTCPPWIWTLVTLNDLPRSRDSQG